MIRFALRSASDPDHVAAAHDQADARRAAVDALHEQSGRWLTAAEHHEPRVVQAAIAITRCAWRDTLIAAGMDPVEAGLRAQGDPASEEYIAAVLAYETAASALRHAQGPSQMFASPAQVRTLIRAMATLSMVTDTPGPDLPGPVLGIAALKVTGAQTASVTVAEVTGALAAWDDCPPGVQTGIDAHCGPIWQTWITFLRTATHGGGFTVQRTAHPAGTRRT